MNQEPCSYALTQITGLVANLNKKNFAASSRQIAQFVKDFGVEADRHLLRALFSAIDFSSDAPPNPAQAQTQNGLLIRLLSEELTGLLTKPQLVGNVCYAVDNLLPQQKTLKSSPHLVAQVSTALGCSPIQEGALALALLNSAHSDTVLSAENHGRICLAGLIESYINLEPSQSSQEGSLNDVTPELLQHILSVLSHGKHREFGLADSTYARFVQQLCRDFPRERVPVVLAPLLYPEDSEVSAEAVKANSQSLLRSSVMDTAWGSLVMEIGYTFTASLPAARSCSASVD